MASSEVEGMVLQDLRREFAAYGSDEWPRVLHAVKAALAAVLCIVICMRIELRSPGTAMVSTVIVMLHQQSGMVIARAFYRALGICLGSLAGLMLMCMFAQQPPLFLAGLALWIGLFVAGASYFRNFQSYGFVLSGYAASITTVAEWSNPYDVATNVIYTVSEVVIGVASGSLVSAIILPQRVTPSVDNWRHSALAKLLHELRGSALGTAVAEPIGRYLDLVRESVKLEQLRTAAVFEDPEMRLRIDALERLETAFLDAMTRIHAICRARQGAARAGPHCRAWLDGQFATLARIVSNAQQTDLRHEHAIDSLRAQLHAFEYELSTSIANERASLPAEPADEAAALAMAGAEVYTTVASLRRFCTASKAATQTPGKRLTQSIVKAVSFLRVVQLRASRTAAMIAGIRACCALGFVGIAWVISEWTNGVTALISAGIASGLSSLSPTPLNASWQMLAGCFCATIAGFIVNFLLMPGFSEVELLVICVGAFVFIGGYIITFAQVTPFGLAFNLYFALTLNLTNPAVYNPPAYLDRSFSLLFGIAVVVASFLLIFPHEGRWVARQHARHIRELLLHAATGTIGSDVSAQIAASIRDLIVRLNTLPNLSGAYREAVRNWAFGSFWIANTLLQVRHYSVIYADLMPLHWPPTEQQWLDAMTAVARHDTRAATEAAVLATQQAIAVLEAPRQEETGTVKGDLALFRITVGLYSVKLALSEHLADWPRRERAMQ
jgi:uncharacterized membrane protein YccC